MVFRGDDPVREKVAVEMMVKFNLVGPFCGGWCCGNTKGSLFSTCMRLPLTQIGLAFEYCAEVTSVRRHTQHVRPIKYR